MCNKLKRLQFKRYNNTLQLYNNLYPEITEIDQFFATLLIFLSLLITPVYAQASSTTTTVSPIESSTALSTTIEPVYVRSLPPPTLYPITNDSLTITELVLANSVIVSNDIPIKIPQDYRYI